MQPGTNPRWADKEKGYDKKHACYPLEIVEIISMARDKGIPAHQVVDAVKNLIQVIPQ